MLFQFIRRYQRIQFEDTLKHIYNSQNRGEHATILSLAGGLGIRLKKSVRLVEELGRRGLVHISGEGLSLTPHGSAWVLQVIRAHRLWESYLADTKGIPLENIHVQAEHKEHSITPDEANKLEAELGYPVRDPHGAPIPLADHTIEQSQSK